VRDNLEVEILVEGFDADALALATHLSAEGHDVRVAAPGPASADASSLVELGITIAADADLDADPGPADIAYLDVWTPPVAPRVQRLRAQGTRISCLGDLLLERWRGPTLGITGTAGKTTTTSLVTAMLEAGGIEVAVSAGARAGNLWPTADLLGRAGSSSTDSSLLVLELTSSHLAFMATSPSIAAVTCFWPDHLELHGDVRRYREAKETIVRHQRPDDLVVVHADDGASSFADVTPARASWFSQSHPVERGAYLDGAGAVIVTDGERRVSLGALTGGTAHPGNVVAAAATASAAGASAEAVAAGARDAPPLQWRARATGTLGGAAVVDDGMAATPAKAAATLSRYDVSSIVLIAGGLDDLGTGPVHAAPEEVTLLEAACDEIARVAQAVVLFGPAGRRLERLLAPRGVRTELAGSLEGAVGRAATQLETAAALVFAPLFPVTLEERASFAGLYNAAAAGP
jgi:UDP-N-acetylmuramoylalanine--D-glutamate ligase